MGSGADAECSLSEYDHEPILDAPKSGDDMSIDDHSSEQPSTDTASPILTDLELGEGCRTTDSYGDDATSMYARSHFPGSVNRGVHRAFDDGATVNSNRSIAPADVEYVWENGRRYTGSYFMPNDKAEQTRLLLVNECYKSAFGDIPTTVSLEDPTAILDIGTGTGEWAMDMADRYPDCEVTGTDIADIFPKYAGQNLFWEIDNAELEWLRPPNFYDLIHFRNMDGAFRDWPFVYEQAFKVCKPGGWIEVMDWDLWNSENYLAHVPPESGVHRCARDWKAAAMESGYLIENAHLKSHLLTDAGFEDVKVWDSDMPINPKSLSSGHLLMKAILDGLEAHALRLLTSRKGYTAEELRWEIKEFRKVFTNIALDSEKSRSFNMRMKVMKGRKPLDSDGSRSSAHPEDMSEMLTAESQGSVVSPVSNTITPTAI
ncbi:S-adenosyl-L-methionine-dependent methyltransferase [Pestalotiopsis sp. NC0098]|nr:S-adenosyl-L-methionine-dependent methyltransferase [Pestalotiopsis sp. NC0098]